MFILTAATNADPFGPNADELLELSILSFGCKNCDIITSLLAERIVAYIDHHGPRAEGPPSLQKRILFSRGSGEKSQLMVSKALTVILYLLQYGSPRFLEWIKANYIALIRPLERLPFGKEYRKSVGHKAAAIVNYCEDSITLQRLRNRTEEIRLEMSTPGVKHLPTVSGRLQNHTRSNEVGRTRFKSHPDSPEILTIPLMTSPQGRSPISALPKISSHFAPNPSSTASHETTITKASSPSTFQLPEQERNNPFKYRNNPFVKS